MIRSAHYSSVLLALMVGIGCGGKPQDASARPGDAAQAERRTAVQLAQAPSGTQTPTPGSQPTASAGGSSTVRGSVRLTGEAPTPSAIKMSADPVCQQQHAAPFYGEEVVVNAGGMLKHVFVYVKEGVQGTFPPPTTPAVLNQSGCWYAPHVMGLQVNQPLEIVNSDATLHNVNAKPTANQPFNLAQPVKGMKATKKFAKPEVMVKFKCNVHPWMNAYAGVVEHPFFSVTDDGGAFTIAGLPAGAYVLEAWHEKYGTETQRLTVADGETASVEFTFTAQ